MYEEVHVWGQILNYLEGTLSVNFAPPPRVSMCGDDIFFCCVRASSVKIKFERSLYQESRKWSEVRRWWSTVRPVTLKRQIAAVIARTDERTVRFRYLFSSSWQISYEPFNIIRLIYVQGFSDEMR